MMSDIVERLRNHITAQEWPTLQDRAAYEIECLREEVARLRAENAWQTIETAPDNESVWLYGGWISTGDSIAENTGVEAWLDRGVWTAEEGETFMRGATVVKGPTHWKRLPAPPTDVSAAIREEWNNE